MDKENKSELRHLFGGLIIFFYGFDCFERSNFKGAAIYISLSLFIIIYSGFQKTLAKRFEQSDAAFFILEAITIVYILWSLKVENHPYFYYTYLAATVLFIIISIKSINFSSLRISRPRKKRKRRKHRSTSVKADRGNAL